MSLNIDSEISRWKMTQFSSYDMRMDVAANSLRKGETPKIVFKGYHPSRLNAFFVENQEPAVLTWAGIYAGGYDIDTGNLVPQGERAPSCVPEDRVQREVDWRCTYSHGIDTTVDRSLYSFQMAIEDHLSRDLSFNLGQRPRKEFQNGKKVEATPRYTFQSKMFAKRSDKLQALKDERKSKRMRWHPWITRALESKPQFYASPDKPSISEFRHGQFHDIHTCKPPYLQAGDVVWFSVKLTVHVTNVNWYTEFIAEEIVRVVAIPEGVDPTGNPVVDGALRARHEPGSIQVPRTYVADLDVNDAESVCNPTADVVESGASGSGHGLEGGNGVDGEVVTSSCLQPSESARSSPLTDADWVPSDEERAQRAAVDMGDDDL
ncbi:hypothetical protein K474DRAFT_1709101 [Panus rudis PR-1116 ss-1]|nr:hypothetical protein K474DRAFT_1709101 [Panus rudis PR-1116 ss-1]